jgi:hypothetical protein
MRIGPAQVGTRRLAATPGTYPSRVAADGGAQPWVSTVDVVASRPRGGNLGVYSADTPKQTNRDLRLQY